MALFGMELRSVDIAVPDGGIEAKAVRGFQDGVTVIVALHEVGVNEVEALFFERLETGGQGAFGVLLDRVPPHVGNLVAHGVKTALERQGPGRYPSQAGQGPFFTRFGKKLHAEADPEDRHLLDQSLVVQRFQEPLLFDPGHGRIERTHAGQQDLVCPFNPGRVHRHHGLHADLPEHVDDRAEVAHAVVDDSEHQIPVFEVYLM